LSVGPGGAAGIGDQNDSMWGWPDSGSCWPVPGSCDQWPDGPTGPWGPSTTWWSVPFGSDPLTNTPPNPDNCAPGPDYQDCRDWENNRKNACNEVAADVSEAAVAAAFMYDSCVSAVASGGTLTLGCLATWAGDVIVTVRTENHMFTCQNPWPGN
jgi:hypothetical protein